jgi:hypothetical protein
MNWSELPPSDRFLHALKTVGAAFRDAIICGMVYVGYSYCIMLSWNYLLPNQSIDITKAFAVVCLSTLVRSFNYNKIGSEYGKKEKSYTEC